MDCLGDVGPVGTCHASWITLPLQIDSIQSKWKIKSFGTFSIQSDRLAFSLAPIYKCLLGDSFFTDHTKLQVDSLKNVDLKRFELKSYKYFSLIRALTPLQSPISIRSGIVTQLDRKSADGNFLQLGPWRSGKIG